MNVRGIFFAIIFFICFGIVGANQVTLYLPADGTTNTTSNNIIFQCKFTGEVIANITFYHDISGVLSANQTDSSPVNGTYSSFTLNNIPNGNYHWNCYATTANNTQFSAGSSFSFAINVLDPNTPRFNGTISAQSWAEDTNKSNAFDLDTYFSDPNSDSLTFSISGNSSINITIDSNHFVSFSQPPNWNGAETIFFIASDGTQSVKSNTIVLTVTAVNDAPYVKENLSHKSWKQGSNLTIDLDEYFGDADGSLLNYSASTLSYISATFNQATGKVTLAAVSSSWTGTEVVTFTANDGLASIGANSINLTVTQGNVAPTIGTSSSTPVNLTKGGSYLFTITKSDAEGDSMDVEWYLNGVLVAIATGDSYSFYANNAGTYNVSVFVSDGSLVTSKEWVFTVASGESVVATADEGGEEGIVEEEGLCGNGEVDEGENCESCAADVQCGEKEVCEEGECVAAAKKGNYNWLIFLIVVLLGVVGIVIYYFIKQNKIRKGSIFDEEEISVAKEAPIKTSPEFIGEVISSPLVEYIKHSLSLGKSKQEIENTLLDKGWKKEQIEEVFGSLGVK